MGRTLEIGVNVKILRPHVFAGNKGVVKYFDKNRAEKGNMPYQVNISNVKGYNVWCDFSHLKVIK